MIDALNLAATVASGWQQFQAHRSSIHHDDELHVRGIAASTEHHYQQMITDLLAASKETDRDVWEQRQGQFNNLMLSATLMFGVAMSAIIEGNFEPSGHETAHRQAMFTVFAVCEAAALSCLFLCLVACLLVSRRMSLYMCAVPHAPARPVFSSSARTTPLTPSLACAGSTALLGSCPASVGS